MVKTTGKKETTIGVKFTPITAPSAEQGLMYFDSSASVIKVSNDGSTFKNMVVGTVLTDAGTTLTADGNLSGVITIPAGTVTNGILVLSPVRFICTGSTTSPGYAKATFNLLCDGSNPPVTNQKSHEGTVLTMQTGTSHLYESKYAYTFAYFITGLNWAVNQYVKITLSGSASNNVGGWSSTCDGVTVICL